MEVHFLADAACYGLYLDVPQSLIQSQVDFSELARSTGVTMGFKAPEGTRTKGVDAARPI